MSLADQSQQWYPTSIQVTVFQARNLRIKGKNGTNDAYAIMQVAKDKFSTSVAEKCVAPVWKEEATFDLPLFHHGNAERCTLHIIVMHRAQVGLDKLLGQAVINLLDLHDNKSRKKTDWFKLLDKNGKADKVRGEVLLDIQFMRNNITASMFDLSMQDKPRSRIAKLKDKVRGKKKDSFSDSASAIVPSVSQVLTDSDGEGDTHSESGAKKKSKLKSLFAPKSNLHRNISQSMSTLGSLPEKNTSLSSSRSSGLNVDSPEVKKKFKFLTHKRTGSNDSKVSQGPFSLLGRSKQSANDQNSLCINGSHVYAEEAEPKTGSTLSLNSSGQGSVEDVRRHNSDVSVDSLKGASVPLYKREPADRVLQEQQRHQEEEEGRQTEERHRAEAKRLHEEEEEEERKQQEEQEMRRRFLEDETRRRKQKEVEEERRRLEVEERQRLEEDEQRQQEEARRAEEQKQQEEASMTDRLSSLFGIIRKKDEKKEEVQPSSTKEEAPKPAPRSFSKDLEVASPHHSTNPFEEISLSPDPPKPFEESKADPQKTLRSPQNPSAMVFINRTAKVSAVKPRLVESLKPETTDSDSDRQQSPTLSSTESSLCSVPSESPGMFSNLHSSLAPPKTRRSTSESPYGSTENLDTQGSFTTASEKKRRAPLPPIYPASTKSENRQLAHHDMPNQMQPQSQAPSRGASAKPAASSYLVPIREVENIEDTAMTGSGKRPMLPLPDYDSLFPQKRHGVQGQTRWDHIIAEVNQRQREYPPQLIGEEMCVDCPKEHPHINKPSLMQERAAGRLNQQPTQLQEAQTTSWKKVGTSSMQAPTPPKPVAAASPRQVTVSNTRQDRSTVQVNPTVEQPNTFVLGSTDLVAPSKKSPLEKPLENAKKVLHTAVTANDGKSVLPTEKPKPASRVVTGDHKGMTINIPKEIPTAKPRQRVVSKEPAREADPVRNESAREADPVRNESAREADPVLTSPRSTTEEQENIRVMGAAVTDTLDMKRSGPVMAENTESDIDKKQETFTEPDLFSSGEALSEDSWAQPEQSHSGPDDLFSGRMQKDEEVEEQGMTPDDLDTIFMPENPTDPFSRFNNNGSEKQLEQKKTDYSNTHSPALHRKKQAPQPPTNSDNSHMLTTTGSHKLELQQDATRQSNLYGTARMQIQAREEQLAADPFALSSSPMSVLAEPTSQPGVLSGGKSLLQAWVSPEVQPHAVISSNGGGPASTPRRPHPVKPMSSTESQPPISTPAVRELKTHESTLGKMKLTGTIVDSGPYTQLTQEELITLVVKQQSELSKKDTKIVELEEYIDNLLVRVMEEQPSILSSLDSAKQVL